jgi:hypothetical protein
VGVVVYIRQVSELHLTQAVNGTEEPQVARLSPQMLEAASESLPVSRFDRPDLDLSTIPELNRWAHSLGR